jgi:hypothetical protein
MGSGKTYLMTRDVIRALRAGVEVWGNAGYFVVAHVDGCDASQDADGTPTCECPHTRTYVSLSEMLLAPQGTLLCLDEVGSFMNARRWTELPRSLMYRLTQARKDSLRLIYTAQHELQTDVALRRLTAVTHHIRRVGPVLCAVAYPPIDFRTSDDKPMYRKWALLREAVMGAYDTHAKVWVPPEVLDELATETKKWVPLTDDMMRELRERVVLAREHPELAGAVDETTEAALTLAAVGAHNGATSNGDAGGVAANASSQKSTARGLSAEGRFPRQGRSRRGNAAGAPGTNGEGRTERVERKGTNGSDVPSFYFDD